MDPPFFLLNVVLYLRKGDYCMSIKLNVYLKVKVELDDKMFDKHTEELMDRHEQRYLPPTVIGAYS